jgi:long-chain acyl-CoA synthetase
MSPAPTVDLVHAPLAVWARSRGDAVAIRCAEQCISFAQLQQRLCQRAAALCSTQAPASVLVHTALPVAERLVDFLGIIASGRCAVVGDPDWPLAVRAAVQAALPTQAATMPEPQANTPFYVGYTSGSSGTPKGYRRHHHSWTSSFQACLDAFGPDAGTCILVPGRDSHSLFLFGMLLGLWSGAGVELQEQFSAGAALHTLRSGRTPCLVAVPSQLLLLLETAQHQHSAPIEAVRLILVSGSRWPRQRTAALRALFPAARIIEFYGASETSFIAWMDTDDTAPPGVVGWPFANVELQLRQPQAGHHGDAGDSDNPDQTSGLEPAAGLIYVRSPMVFMDYVGGAEDATAALRDGDWISVRDLGYMDARGRLCLAGRQNRMLVTLGKNLFPEAVEAVLEQHPCIASASVHGLDDPVRGLQVVAILRWAERPSSSAGAHAVRPDALALKAWCKQRLEAFKVPRTFLLSAHWCFTASGKTDHRALAQALARPGGPKGGGAIAAQTPLPWLIPLP